MASRHLASVSRWCRKLGGRLSNGSIIEIAGQLALESKATSRAKQK
jgi:hypothetical protein